MCVMMKQVKGNDISAAKVFIEPTIYRQWFRGAPIDPNSAGVKISGAKAISTECYGFEHFHTSTMPINPRKNI